jgi:succinate dehydrogenase / fumarate reductase, membrane anchor subunit
MALYSRSGRPRPQSGGFELGAWYFMRLSGVALFVLALTHFSVQHFLSDPKDQTATWIFTQAWNSVLRRGLDWLMLVFVLAHMILGMRTVTMDYLKSGKRMLALSALYLAGAFVFMMGTIVVFTVKMPGA